MLSSPSWGYTEFVLLPGDKKEGEGSKGKQRVRKVLGTKKPVGSEEGKTVYNPYNSLLRLLRTERLRLPYHCLLYRSAVFIHVLQVHVSSIT